MKPLKLIIVEDHSVLRETLIIALNMEKEFEIIGDWGNAEDALDNLNHMEFDVAVIDRALPGMNGVALMKRLKEKDPEAKVLMLSMMTAEKKILEAFEAGVKGFVPKEAPISILIDAIKKVHQGETFVTRDITESLIKYFTTLKDRASSNGILTDEQREVLALAADGLTNKEIAAKMDLALPIIKRRFREIFKVLKARHRTHAIIKAVKMELITLDD